jgi:hypothetical protein
MVMIQKPELTFMDGRTFYDTIKAKFPCEFEKYLSNNSDIISNFNFENGLCKVLDNKEY